MLIKCPECSHDISNKAIACPNCGFPMIPANSDKNKLVRKAWQKVLLELTPKELFLAMNIKAKPEEIFSKYFLENETSDNIGIVLGLGLAEILFRVGVPPANIEAYANFIESDDEWQIGIKLLGSSAEPYLAFYFSAKPEESFISVANSALICISNILNGPFIDTLDFMIGDVLRLREILGEDISEKDVIRLQHYFAEEASAEKVVQIIHQYIKANPYL